MIRLQVTNRRLDRLSAPEAFFLGLRHRPALASVQDSDPGVIRIHAPIAQINDHLPGHRSCVLQQDPGLFQLCAQHMTITWVACKRPGPHDQPFLVRDRKTGLDAELVVLSCLALADALDLWSVHRIELATSLGGLVSQRLCPLQYGFKPVHQGLALGQHLRQLALNLPDQPAEYGLLAFEHLAQALELARMGVASSLAP